jgi:protein tyrosine phosphatase (PTP) superfamily phosphohydrolase (DUF442 family)
MSSPLPATAYTAAAATMPPAHDVPSPSRAAALAFSRTEELRLKELRRRAEDPALEPLTATEQNEYLVLERKYKEFEEDGLRKLLEGQRDIEATRREASFSESLSGAVEGVARGAFFWGSWVATAGPGYVGRKIGLTDQDRFKHWNFITDYVILGALPVITQLGTSGNHLMQIQRHCQERNSRIGMVVSVITRSEMSGFGISYPRFAKHEDWRRDLGVEIFEQVEVDDMTATGADFNSIRRVVEKMHRVATECKECVYVHCKAGKGRSWMVVICYLCTQMKMDFDEAIAYARSKRHQVSPSFAQIKFAKDFVEQYRVADAARQLYGVQLSPTAPVTSGGASHLVPNMTAAVVSGPPPSIVSGESSRLDAMAGRQAGENASDWVMADLG